MLIQESNDLFCALKAAKINESHPELFASIEDYVEKSDYGMIALAEALELMKIAGLEDGVVYVNKIKNRKTL